MTPDSTRRPLSPLDSLAPVDSRWGAFNQPLLHRRSVSSAQIDYDIDEDATDEEGPDSERPRAYRQLLLLKRSRGVQTDSCQQGPGLASPLPSHTSHLSLSTPPDPRSESSSFSESLSSHVTALFDRATSLLQRMTQADALTLTNRLKRQNLKGADVNHLSRTTVTNIVAEAIELRAQFRSLLEDEKIVVTCTRKDLRILFKLFKDMFMELGQLRVTVNDVILDPSCAQRISELALNPTKAAEEKENGGSSGPSWMAPLSRLFSATQRRERSPVAPSRTNSSLAPPRAPRLAPKLGPALAASTTTVNVEFSGAGVGRATTTVAAPQIVTSPPASDTQSIAPSGSASVMGIFAGAPKPVEDPWVVLPRAGPRRVQSTYFQETVAGTATLGRSNFKKVARLSRNVDAVLDSEQRLESVLPEESEEAVDEVTPLQGYPTLRRRGLSDSSIHSTFTSHGEDGPPDSPSSPKKAGPFFASKDGSSSGGLPQWYDGNSVFQALSRTVQNLRLATSGSASGVKAPEIDSSHGSEATSSALVDALQRSQITTTAQTSAGPSTAPSIQHSLSSDPDSPMVEAPSRSGTPQPLGEASAQSTLTPQGTPRSAKWRPKVISPRRNSRDPGIVGSFLPNLNLASWIPAASDVTDKPGDTSDPFSAASGTLNSVSPTAESGPFSGRRRVARPRGAGGSRDFSY